MSTWKKCHNVIVNKHNNCLEIVLSLESLNCLCVRSKAEKKLWFMELNFIELSLFFYVKNRNEFIFHKQKRKEIHLDSDKLIFTWEKKKIERETSWNINGKFVAFHIMYFIICITRQILDLFPPSLVAN